MEMSQHQLKLARLGNQIELKDKDTICNEYITSQNYLAKCIVPDEELEYASHVEPTVTSSTKSMKKMASNKSVQHSGHSTVSFSQQFDFEKDVIMLESSNMRPNHGNTRKNRPKTGMKSKNLERRLKEETGSGHTVVTSKSKNLERGLKDETGSRCTMVASKSKNLERGLKEETGSGCSVVASKSKNLERGLKDETESGCSEVASNFKNLERGLKDETGSGCSEVASNFKNLERGLKDETGSRCTMVASKSKNLERGLKEETGSGCSVVASKSKNLERGLKDETESGCSEVASNFKNLERGLKEETGSGCSVVASKSKNLERGLKEEAENWHTVVTCDYEDHIEDDTDIFISPQEFKKKLEKLEPEYSKELLPDNVMENTVTEMSNSEDVRERPGVKGTRHKIIKVKPKTDPHSRPISSHTQKVLKEDVHHPEDLNDSNLMKEYTTTSRKSQVTAESSKILAKKRQSSQSLKHSDKDESNQNSSNAQANLSQNRDHTSHDSDSIFAEQNLQGSDHLSSIPSYPKEEKGRLSQTPTAAMTSLGNHITTTAEMISTTKQTEISVLFSETKPNVTDEDTNDQSPNIADNSTIKSPLPPTCSRASEVQDSVLVTDITRSTTYTSFKYSDRTTENSENNASMKMSIPRIDKHQTGSGLQLEADDKNQTGPDIPFNIDGESLEASVCFKHSLLNLDNSIDDLACDASSRNKSQGHHSGDDKAQKLTKETDVKEHKKYLGTESITTKDFSGTDKEFIEKEELATNFGGAHLVRKEKVEDLLQFPINTTGTNENEEKVDLLKSPSNASGRNESEDNAYLLKSPSNVSGRNENEEKVDLLKSPSNVSGRNENEEKVDLLKSPSNASGRNENEEKVDLLKSPSNASGRNESEDNAYLLKSPSNVSGRNENEEKVDLLKSPSNASGRNENEEKVDLLKSPSNASGRNENEEKAYLLKSPSNASGRIENEEKVDLLKLHSNASGRKENEEKAYLLKSPSNASGRNENEEKVDLLKSPSNASGRNENEEKVDLVKSPSNGRNENEEKAYLLKSPSNASGRNENGEKVDLLKSPSNASGRNENEEKTHLLKSPSNASGRNESEEKVDLLKSLSNASGRNESEENTHLLKSPSNASGRNENEDNAYLLKSPSNASGRNENEEREKDLLQLPSNTTGKNENKEKSTKHKNNSEGKTDIDSDNKNTQTELRTFVSKDVKSTAINCTLIKSETPMEQAPILSSKDHGEEVTSNMEEIEERRGNDHEPPETKLSNEGLATNNDKEVKESDRKMTSPIKTLRYRARIYKMTQKIREQRKENKNVCLHREIKSPESNAFSESSSCSLNTLHGDEHQGDSTNSTLESCSSLSGRKFKLEHVEDILADKKSAKLPHLEDLKKKLSIEKKRLRELPLSTDKLLKQVDHHQNSSEIQSYTKVYEKKEVCTLHKHSNLAPPQSGIELDKSTANNGCAPYGYSIQKHRGETKTVVSTPQIIRSAETLGSDSKQSGMSHNIHSLRKEKSASLSMDKCNAENVCTPSSKTSITDSCTVSPTQKLDLSMKNDGKVKQVLKKLMQHLHPQKAEKDTSGMSLPKQKDNYAVHSEHAIRVRANIPEKSIYSKSVDEFRKFEENMKAANEVLFAAEKRINSLVPTTRIVNEDKSGGQVRTRHHHSTAKWKTSAEGNVTF